MKNPDGSITEERLIDRGQLTAQEQAVRVVFEKFKGKNPDDSEINELAGSEEMREHVRDLFARKESGTPDIVEESSTSEKVEIPAIEPTPHPEEDQPTLTPEQQREAWLNAFETRFTSSTELHEGIEWVNVQNALKADPETVKRLMAFDAKGHNMNVLGETPEEFIFVSSWTDYNQVSPDHRTITYDTKGQELAESMGGHRPNGNAVKIIADIMGIKEEEAVNYLADEKFHEQLRKAIGVNGWAWLKTDPEYREKTGDAVVGDNGGIYGNDADDHNRGSSFRAALRVKKV